MPWGRNRSYGAAERDPTAFTQSDYSMLMQAINKMANTAFGVVAEPYTADELARLFVPPAYLTSLRLTFALEEKGRATADIYVSMPDVVGKNTIEPVFEEPDARCIPDRAVLNIEFNRTWAKEDGFITPRPVFGTVMDPMTSLPGSADEALKERFRDQCRLLMRTAGEWATVRWVLTLLHESLRTPPQVRYIWPAIYTIAKVANLSIADSLAQPSTRAGTNAKPDPAVMAFLKPTYDVVSHSVLLGERPDMHTRYINGQMTLYNCAFATRKSATDNVTIHGV